MLELDDELGLVEPEFVELELVESVFAPVEPDVPAATQGFPLGVVGVIWLPEFGVVPAVELPGFA